LLDRCSDDGNDLVLFHCLPGKSGVLTTYRPTLGFRSDTVKMQSALKIAYQIGLPRSAPISACEQACPVSPGPPACGHPADGRSSAAGSFESRRLMKRSGREPGRSLVPAPRGEVRAHRRLQAARPRENSLLPDGSYVSLAGSTGPPHA